MLSWKRFVAACPFEEASSLTASLRFVTGAPQAWFHYIRAEDRNQSPSSGQCEAVREGAISAVIRQRCSGELGIKQNLVPPSQAQGQRRRPQQVPKYVRTEYESFRGIPWAGELLNSDRESNAQRTHHKGFSQERTSAMAALNPVERILLGLSNTILGHRALRGAFVLYAFALHFFVFLTVRCVVSHSVYKKTLTVEFDNCSCGRIPRHQQVRNP